jgi:outer membrane autotransporter protein
VSTVGTSTAWGDYKQVPCPPETLSEFDQILRIITFGLFAKQPAECVEDENGEVFVLIRSDLLKVGPSGSGGTPSSPPPSSTGSGGSGSSPPSPPQKPEYPHFSGRLPSPPPPTPPLSHPEAKTSGCLANAIRSGGSKNDSKEIFARVNSRTKEEKSGVWAQAGVAFTKYSGDDKSLGDYTDNEKSGLIGYDTYVAQEKLPGKLMLGAYAKINGHEMSQGSTDKGNITNAGAGVYGSYEEEKWEIRAIINGSYDMYKNNEREVSFSNDEASSVDKKMVKAEDFDGYGIGCNLEGALKIKLSDTFNLRPYLGLDTRRSHYGLIKEKSSDEELNVNTESGNYDRVFAKAGLVVGQKIDKFGWNVNAEYKRLLSNNVPKIISHYTDNEIEKEITDVGIEEGRDVLGAGVGGSYDITEKVSVFASVNIFGAKRYQNIQGNVGISYRFGPSDRGASRKNRKKVNKKKRERLNKYLHGASRDREKERFNKYLYELLRKRLKERLNKYLQGTKGRRKMSKEEKEAAKVRKRFNKYLCKTLRDKLLKN